MKSQAQNTSIGENFDNITSLQGTKKEEMATKERLPQSSKSGIKVFPEE